MRTILTVLVIAFALPARAGDLPELKIDVMWGTRPSALARIEAAERSTRLPYLYVYLAAGIALDRIGGNTSSTTLEGVSPPYLAAGAAFAYDYGNENFRGYLLGALDFGVADVAYGATGGVHGRVDLDYVVLYGDIRGFGTPGFATTYAFGLRVRPYVKFIELLADCDSMDGSTEERAKPCGAGVRLIFTLPSTPITLAISGKATFFDLAAQIGSVGGRAGLTLYLER